MTCRPFLHSVRAPRRSIGLTLVLLVCGAASVGAQEPVDGRPFRGLFGTTPQRPDEGRTLDFNASVLGAYDDNVAANRGNGATQGGNADPRFQVSGAYSGLTLQLAYARRGPRLTGGFELQSSARYYPDLRQLSSVGHAAGFSFQTSFGSRLTLASSQSIQYAPYYVLGLAGTSASSGQGPLLEPAADFGVSNRQALAAQVQTRLAYKLTARSTIALMQDFSNHSFADDDRYTRQQTIAGTFQYQLLKYVTLRAGYGQREFRLPSGVRRTEIQDLGLGADYSRPLSFSRRTTLTFTTGSSILSQTQGLRLRLTGAAALDHHIGRTWTARATYARGVRAIDGLDELTFADSASVSIGGYLTRRLDWNNTASWVTGQIGLEERSGRRYDTYLVSSRLRFALTRYVAAFANYLYYYYDFDRQVQLPTGVAQALDRRGVRVGVMVWTPLLR